MAKLLLDVEEDYSYEVLGLVSTAKSYRLCWTVNKLLGVDLKRAEDITIFNKKRASGYHACYTFYDESFHVKYRLVENKRRGSYFLPEIEKADYLLVLDENEEVPLYLLREKLKASSMIQLTFRVDLKELKSKQNILLSA
jgi:hypothetical protein